MIYLINLMEGPKKSTEENTTSGLRLKTIKIQKLLLFLNTSCIILTQVVRLLDTFLHLYKHGAMGLEIMRSRGRENKGGKNFCNK